MKNYKRFIFTLVFLLIFGFVLYNELPKRGTFNSLALKKYSNIEFMRVMIDYDSIHISSKDTDPLSKLLSYMKDFKLIEDKHLDYFPKEYNSIYAYAEDGSSLQIIIHTKNHIYVETYLNGGLQHRNYYKIIGDGLDMNYVQDLLKQFKSSETM